jgi:glucose/arabinose dehydrogenase
MDNSVRAFLTGLALLSPTLLFAAPPGDLALTPITTLSNTVAIRNAGDGSSRLFLVQRQGIIRVFDLKTNTLLATPFLDITTAVDDANSEQGLLGLAFHPNYENNGFFYVNYTRDPGPGLDRTVIERYQVSVDPNVANAASGFTLLEIAQDFDNHNGGDIHFGPDGFLYIGMGDGGSGGDPNNRSQDRDQLLGKMLRIDVAQPSLERRQKSKEISGVDLCGLVTNYTIPPSNPFIADALTCDEIWALGVRNPWRWSFDRKTGDLLMGDVGQGPSNPREEINFQPASSTGGENYGWSCAEGTLMPNYNPCLPGVLTGPIIEFDHSAGRCAVTGGYRYRGTMVGLDGTYMYADFCGGQINFATFNGVSWSTSLWNDFNQNITTFGEDVFGEVYLANSGNGQILTFTSSQRAFFNDGFETGTTANWSAVVP